MVSIFSNRKFAYTIFGLLIVNIWAMQYFGAPLKNTVCLNGIVSFELAKELTVSKDILNSWNTSAKISAGINLGVDFLFLLVYATFISLLIYRINEKLWKNNAIYRIGQILIYATFIAALFDIIENIALIKLLLGDLQQTWSSMAYYFAMSKFIILLVSITYLITSWITLLFKKA